jgi:general secretion pathway protein O/leader peptidase (prepilin peptidase)/N-methyltransferase
MNTLTLLNLSSPLLFVVLSAIAGGIIGSFLGVVIERVPAAILEGNEILPSLLFPPSHCPECQHRLSWWENIPLISWLCLRGRCSGCGVRIPLRLLQVEFFTLLFFAITAWHFPEAGQFLPLWILWCGVLPLTYIDARHLLLPDAITLPLLWCGLIYATTGAGIPLVDAVLGAVAGYLSLWLVYWAFRAVTGREGLGYGDFKLLAALGAWLGWQALPMVLLIASFTAIVFHLLLKARRQQEIPFGPALSVAGLVLAVIQMQQSIF